MTQRDHIGLISQKAMADSDTLGLSRRDGVDIKEQRHNGLISTEMEKLIWFVMIQVVNTGFSSLMVMESNSQILEWSYQIGVIVLKRKFIGEMLMAMEKMTSSAMIREDTIGYKFL